MFGCISVTPPPRPPLLVTLKRRGMEGLPKLLKYEVTIVFLVFCNFFFYFFTLSITKPPAAASPNLLGLS